MKRIIQMVDSLNYGDAIGNHAVAISRKLSALGITNTICVNYADPRLEQYATLISDYHEEADDIVIYHLCTGSSLSNKVMDLHCKVIINYHNITPPSFFSDYGRRYYDGAMQGYKEARMLAERADYVVTPSEYNKSEMIKLGYKCPIDVVPIIIKFDDYQQTPDENVLNTYRNTDSDYKNIIFVGRIVPNKRQEDLLKDFCYYQKYYHEKSRLFIIGNYVNMELYYLQLKKYIKNIKLQNVIFPGHISFSELLAYYRASDLFLCESEHEGFCVPLVEAMYFKVPLIAYASSAIPDTVGDAGLLLQKKNPAYTASLMNELLSNPQEIKSMQQRQTERLKCFDENVVFDKLMQVINEL